ncbi:ExbD/TolR family protein [Propionispora vibrioides]|jgi:biopolymer transport protein ExbD|uniref:Outer membrane transport energization protein ExbD n=1 Tax=Propionispora vibrioides TaxID=112903 RepID=A0A1H8XVN4_9FIRM|nr:biopolymer transporter ExbD [Propionispora vibrioides]SEP43949.1 outer membrane transport energization protein ExbD [Propionispora vibrioides]
MKLHNLRANNQPEFMIIPMIDIIFFLLVFFMMSTLYMVDQHTLPVNLPKTAAAQHDIAANIAITVLENGTVLYDQEELPLPLLAKRVRAELGGQPEASFVLRADKGTDYEKVITVLDEIKLAGARKISLAGEPKAR